MNNNLPLPLASVRTKNIVISGTNFWNPGDDFVRDGIIRVLREVFPGEPLNFLFYNFNADFFPRDKFAGIGNDLAKGDLDKYRDLVDAVIIAGLSAGDEIKDLYRWVVANALEQKVYLIGAGYENGYVEQHIGQEPEATIFRQARLVTGRTAKTPEFIQAAGIPYHHINCPAILSVPEVKKIAPGKTIRRIGFSLQLPHGEGLTNHSCAREQYDLAMAVLRDLSRHYEVEIVAHHKTEYLHFVNLLRGENIPVFFSSFYEDLHEIYPRYDLVITTRLHASLFANGHGIPGIIINDTDRHTHTLEGFQHSNWVRNRPEFEQAFARWNHADLAAVARELTQFKSELLAKYVAVLSKSMGANSRPSADNYAFDSEKKEQSLVRSLFRPGMTAFDVGANIGKYTKLFSLLAGESGKVFAFEPDPGSVQKLRGLVQRDTLANVSVVNVAVADTPGRALLNQFPEEYCSWNGMGRPQMEDPRNPSQYVPIVGSVEVEKVTLDGFCQANGITQIDYLKLDVEGAELHALKGARDLLSRQAIRHLQFEVSLKMLEGLATSAKPVFDLLATFGYECHAISDTGEIAGVVTDSSAFYDNYIALPAQTVSLPEGFLPTALVAAAPQPMLSPLPDLPVHFFTIVLNGQPFINHHIEQLRQLPFAWHWHIIEGVAELNHDTAWSKATGGLVPPDLHRNGLSIDGTTEYLNSLQEQFPKNITIYRPPAGKFWDGKREMVNAPLANISKESLLWQIDADELWTASQIIRTRALFLAQPQKTAAFFYCHYFVGSQLVITSRDTYGNHTSYEWLRVWRYQPGDRWIAHEPPRLSRGETDVASLNPFRHAETESMGLVFQHYAYATEAQLQFKESYYGYAGALAQWCQLQQADTFPQRLASHFSWVKDDALVHTAASVGIQRLAPPEWFGIPTAKISGPLDEAQRILFVRTDSIGDAVLASCLLEPIRRANPSAKLAVLCQQHVADLFAACPFVDTIICYDRKKMEDPAECDQIYAEIAKFQPDVILNSVRSRDPFSNDITQAFRAARHIAIEGDLDNTPVADYMQSLSGYEQIVDSPGHDKPELARHADFLRGLGIPAANLQPVVWTSLADEALADAFFQQQQLNPANTMALFPFTQHGIKDYPAFAPALASFPDWNFLIFGGQESQSRCEILARKLPGRVINLAGRTNLREMAAILRRCRIMVGSDSSGPHMACAVGVPNVVVLGGGHFGRFMPGSPLTSAVSLPLDCFGCRWGCKYEHAHCIKDVSAQVLTEAIRQTLAKRSSRPRLFLQSIETWKAEASLPQWQMPHSFISIEQVEIITISPPSSTPKSQPEKTSVAVAGPALPCPVCQAPSPFALSKKSQNYHRCPSCECVFTPQIAVSILVTENNGHSARHDQGQDQTRLLRVKQTLGRPPEQLIDFGCGAGETTRFLQSLGIPTSGIDHDTPLQLKDVPDASVDGIMMVEVIEHLYEPHAVFQQFNRILKTGGVVYVESSFADAKDLSNWPYLDPTIGHCTVHTIGSMAMLAKQCGFGLQWLNPNVCTLNKQVNVVMKNESNPAQPGDVEIVGDGISQPEVSVVISTYKSEQFMTACLQNLTRQTIFDRCEILVVDSGSPENERGIVAEFQKKYSNIRYIRTPRELLSAAWNRGLEHARGRYWVNVNTDDSIRDDALAILVAALDKNADCALAYCDPAWTTKPNDTFPSANLIKTVRYAAYRPIDAFFYCTTGCLQFWRVSSFRQLGGYDAALQCVGDYEVQFRLIAARMNAVHVPEVLSLFYQNTTGLTQASDRSAKEQLKVMEYYRNSFNVSDLFKANPADPATLARAWATVGVYAAKFTIPWESNAFEHFDFAFDCFHKALNLDPENTLAGMNLVDTHIRLNRLNQNEADLVRRWPRMRNWIDRMRAGEPCPRSDAEHTVMGPDFRPEEWLHRPTPEQLVGEPEALRPWICRISGRHVYLSRDLFPLPVGLNYQSQELQNAGRRLAVLLTHLPPFYAHFGGAGDLLLLMASFYDGAPKSVVFSHPNSVPATQALFEGFPELSKIYFLSQHTEPFFHIILRYAVKELKNCLGAGTTPKDDYDVEWQASLNIEKKYGIHKTPCWAAALRQNNGSRQIAVAPKGSLSGMVGSKRNIILPELWPAIIAHIQERGFEPVILGVPAEALEYPALPGCQDARAESFVGQMRLIGQCAGVVAADSWAKTFSALAEIPTIVFEPLKGADIASWKDASDWVFIEPWSSIKMIRSVDEFRLAFDARIAKIPGVTCDHSGPAVVAWEGSFLDYGSLSHINRELSHRLPATLNLTRVGPNALSASVRNDNAMVRCAKQLAAKAPDNTVVTVRHQWPPNWKKPASGLLVVIQPWEFGALPKDWVTAAANVDEFWVPSPLVRHMYMDSGIAPEKVRVIPNGVDTNKYRPGVKPLNLATKKKFKFLFVGGTIFRKGPDILLDAYVQAFTALDDVCLVVKDFGGDSCYQGQTAEAAIREIKRQPGTPEILYLTKELSAEQMPALYAACDCLVLPYRGEGFGMPVLEAMSCGLPVIVTAGGATESFVTRDAGWKIPGCYQIIGDRIGNLPLVKPGWLIEPSKAHLATLLKQAASFPDECRRRGANGREVAVRKFDWNDIAATVAHRLKELAEKAPAAPAVVVSVPVVVEKKPMAKSAPLPLPEVARVGQLNEARELLTDKKYQAAWQAATTALNHRPFHPEAFLLLAEIALAVGDGTSARKCAQHARNLAAGWERAQQFLKQPLKAGSAPSWLKLPGPIQAAAPGQLSVCLIVKNEETFLPQCLKSIRDLASQIVVVDTGSHDRTVEIAREFGAEIHSFAWSDDFAAARNVALQFATGDWVLMLDADEELPASQHARLVNDLKNAEVMGYRLPLVNRGQEAEGRSHVPRLFRNAPGIFFVGRIHEQLFPSILPLCRTWGGRTALGTAELLHHGYTREMVRDRNKVARNLKLLQLAVTEHPDDVNLRMNLGLELVRSDDLEGGIASYREAFEMMSAQQPADLVPELREVLLTQFTSQLYKIMGHAEVVQVLTSPLAKHGGLTASLHLTLGLSCFELRDYRQSADHMRQCLAKRAKPALSPINVDIHGAAPHHCFALCLDRLGDKAGAEKAFQAALAASGTLEAVKFDYAKFLAAENQPVEALKKLNEIVAAQPHHVPAWKLGGEIALSCPEFFPFACDWTREAIRALPDNSTLLTQAGEAFMFSGHAAAAAELWERLQASQPCARHQAAQILCELVAGASPLAFDLGGQEPAISLAFIQWYQKLIAIQGNSTIEAINAHLDKLTPLLPTAGHMLEVALAQTPVCQLV
jgi:FkbM family methyltransferase